MLFHDLYHQQTETPPNISSKPQETAKFTVKPTGELRIEGQPNQELLQQILTSYDYHQSSSRQLDQILKIKQTNIDLMVAGVLGSTFLITLIGFFLTFNHQGINSNGKSSGGINCSQIK
jgi:hypothetical protein